MQVRNEHVHYGAAESISMLLQAYPNFEIF